MQIHVVDVEATQFTHPDAGGVEQLEHRQVAQTDGVRLGVR